LHEFLFTFSDSLGELLQGSAMDWADYFLHGCWWTQKQSLYLFTWYHSLWKTLYLVSSSEHLGVDLQRKVTRYLTDSCQWPPSKDIPLAACDGIISSCVPRQPMRKDIEECSPMRANYEEGLRITINLGGS